MDKKDFDELASALTKKLNAILRDSTHAILDSDMDDEKKVILAESVLLAVSAQIFASALLSEFVRTKRADFSKIALESAVRLKCLSIRDKPGLHDISEKVLEAVGLTSEFEED